MVVVPITHDLIHVTTVHTARLSLSLLDEVAEERRARRKCRMVDVTVQRLVHSGMADQTPRKRDRVLILVAGNAVNMLQRALPVL
jgi:hypothetical protein